VGRLGPQRLTLAHVAREVGLAPATLVQRFGSKRGLLLALVREAGSDTETFIAGLERIKSPLARLLSFLECYAGMASSPKEMANHLAFFQLDITDPVFHKITKEHSRITERMIRDLLDQAVAAKELAPMDTARLARVLGALVGGSLLSWAIMREGTAVAWLRRDIETVLGPLRVGG
jgi:AcrR family transcriptional regulator